MQLHGIHHLTAITAKARGNYAFYTDVLGMRLVKKTVNQDDVSAYHLFYADGKGSPGTDLTFFDWPAVPEGRGTHSIVGTGLRVGSEAALQWWMERFENRQVRHRGIVERDGRLTLDFEDPEGQRLSFIDDGASGEAYPWDKSPVPTEHQIRGLGPITISIPKLERTDSILQDLLNMRPARQYEANAGSNCARLRNGFGRALCRIARRGRAGAATRPAGSGRRASCRIAHHPQRLQRMGRSPRAGPSSLERTGGSLLLPQPLFSRAQRHSL